MHRISKFVFAAFAMFCMASAASAQNARPVMVMVADSASVTNIGADQMNSLFVAENNSSAISFRVADAKTLGGGFFAAVVRAGSKPVKVVSSDGKLSRSLASGEAAQIYVVTRGSGLQVVVLIIKAKVFK